MKKIAIICLIGLLSACSYQIKTSTDYRPEVNLTTLKTFAYFPAEAKEVIDIYHDRVKNALTRALAAKGLKPAEESQADTLVTFRLVAETVSQQRVTITGGGWHYGSYDYGTAINASPIYVDNIEYKVGNLIIDFIDPKDRKVVFHAVASTSFDAAKTPGQRDKLVSDMVDKMLADFPPSQHPSQPQ